MKRSVRLAIVFAVLAATVTVLPAAPALACSGPGTRHGTETIVLTTFEVTMESVKKAYRRGQTAKIRVTVMRPGKEDPLGQGIPMDPPEQFPAEDVTVGVGLRIGDVFLSGYAFTGEDGVAVVEIPIRHWVRPGRAMANAQASQNTFESPCLTVKEFGWTQSPFLFKVN